MFLSDDSDVEEHSIGKVIDGIISLSPVKLPPHPLFGAEPEEIKVKDVMINSSMETAISSMVNVGSATFHERYIDPNGGDTNESSVYGNANDGHNTGYDNESDDATTPEKEELAFGNLFICLFTALFVMKQVISTLSY